MYDIAAERSRNEARYCKISDDDDDDTFWWWYVDDDVHNEDDQTTKSYSIEREYNLLDALTLKTLTPIMIFCDSSSFNNIMPWHHITIFHFHNHYSINLFNQAQHRKQFYYYYMLLFLLLTNEWILIISYYHLFRPLSWFYFSSII